MSAAGLNLTEQVRDGIARHSSRAELPATLEGRIVRLIDRVAYINHDIDDAVRAGLLSEGELPAEPIEVLGHSGSARIDALVHDMVEHSERAGDIVQGPEAGPAMAQLRDFMFERVYLGPAVRAEHEKIEAVLSRLFEHYVEHPELLPAGTPRGGARGARAAGDRLPRRDDRPLLHQGVHRAPGAAGVREIGSLDGPLHARVAGRGPRRGRLRRAGRRAHGAAHGPGPARYEGLCPFHDERTPSFGIDPAQKVYYCFGCQASGDVFTFVQETEGVDFRGALELLAERYGIELQREQEDPREAERRRERDRLLELLSRTTDYYQRYLWESKEAAHAREYLAGQGAGGGDPAGVPRGLLAERVGHGAEGFASRGVLRERALRGRARAALA